MQLVQTLVRLGEVQEAEQVVRSATQQAVTPQRVQRATNLLQGLSSSGISSETSVRTLLALFENLHTWGVPRNEALSLKRLQLACEAAPGATSLILEEVRATSSRWPNSAGRARALAGDALFALEDAGPSLRFLLGLVQDPSAPAAELAPMLVIRLAALGNAQDASWLLDQIDGQGLADALLADAGYSVDSVLTIADRKAEVAYTLANIAQLRGRDAFAAELYEMTLRLAPEHPWASNNYAYLMLERGGDLARATSLLEVAIRELPDSHNVIDSLGWARYKLGQLEDQPQADGSPAREGAVSLLRRSAMTPEGQFNFEVQDHLGDAQWRIGQKQEARASWRKSLNLVRAELEQAAARQREGADTIFDMRIEELREVVRRIESKLGSEEPAIAPLGIDPVFRPRPEPARPNTRPPVNNAPQQP
jgi:tetratricopeptide (TPR) repeat protein